MRIIARPAVFLIALSIELLAYRDGPLPKMTGGFGEPSCHSCHLDHPLNAPGGLLILNGVPRSYTRGQTYQITVDLTREGMKRGRFEMSARFASGTQKGKQVGVWRPLDERVRVIPSETEPSLQFVQHTTAGTLATAEGAARWTVEWTAPPATPHPTLPARRPSVY